MTCETCETSCRQGRDCAGSLNASRAALGLRPLAPLNQQEGGNYFELYQPATTPTAEEVWARRVGVVAFVVVIVLTGIAAALGANVIRPFA